MPLSGGVPALILGLGLELDTSCVECVLVYRVRPPAYSSFGPVDAAGKCLPPLPIGRGKAVLADPLR